MAYLLDSWIVIGGIFALFVVLVKYFRSFLTIKGITDRHIFITGCDTGFGRLLAESLDEKGVHVFAGCLTTTHAAELRERCSSRLKTVQIDVTDSESVQKAAVYVSKELQCKALWALVNNAGIAGLHVPFEWSKKEDIQKVLDVNLLGNYDVTLTFLPLLKRGKEGRVVNVSSIVGRVALSLSGYIISKYGVEAFSDGLSAELRPYNISVHTITPGMFQTGMINTVDEQMRKRFAELSGEVKDNFGGEDYLKRLTEYLHKAVECGISSRLHLVVDAYQHALLSKHPNNRYIVGNDAKYFFIPLSWLPSSYQVIVTDFLQRFTGIFRPLPKDAVIGR